MKTTRVLPRNLRSAGCSRVHRGFSLVVVLVLLTALAWGTAASLRSSAGSTRMAWVALMQAYAQEQAQLALAHCQSQLLLPSSARDPKLADSALQLSTPEKPAWASAELWRTQTLLVVAPLNSMQPDGLPAVCFTEQQALAEQPRGLHLHLVTARGLSPDYRVDPSSGNAVAGQAFWLQRALLIEDGHLRARTDRRLLNPPLR